MFQRYIFRIYILDIPGEYTMKTISLKVDDSIFGDTEQIVALKKKPRNRYINEAIDFTTGFKNEKF